MVKLERQQFKMGATLIKENDLSRKLFILRKGKVRVFKHHNGGKVTLATLGPGEIFGELSFLDAKKRSASVQALSDVQVDFIDGNNLESEIEKLPGWIHIIFKSVAQKFRVVDEKMTVLQSILEFQNKTSSSDRVAEHLYEDLLRSMRIINLLIKTEGNSFKKEEIIEKLNEVTGRSIVTPKGLIKAFTNEDFFELDIFDMKDKYQFKTKDIDLFETYLNKNIERSKPYILSNEAMSVLKIIISAQDLMQLSEMEKPIKIGPENLPQKDDTNLLRGFDELEESGLLIKSGSGAEISPYTLIHEYRFQRIIKSFDQSTLYRD